MLCSFSCSIDGEISAHLFLMLGKYPRKSWRCIHLPCIPPSRIVYNPLRTSPNGSEVLVVFNSSGDFLSIATPPIKQCKLIWKDMKNDLTTCFDTSNTSNKDMLSTS